MMKVKLEKEAKIDKFNIKLWNKNKNDIIYDRILVLNFE